MRGDLEGSLKSWGSYFLTTPKWSKKKVKIWVK
jgi:hypothetical protein